MSRQAYPDWCRRYPTPMSVAASTTAMQTYLHSQMLRYPGHHPSSAAYPSVPLGYPIQHQQHLYASRSRASSATAIASPPDHHHLPATSASPRDPWVRRTSAFPLALQHPVTMTREPAFSDEVPPPLDLSKVAASKRTWQPPQDDSRPLDLSLKKRRVETPDSDEDVILVRAVNKHVPSQRPSAWNGLRPNSTLRAPPCPALSRPLQGDQRKVPRPPLPPESLSRNLNSLATKAPNLSNQHKAFLQKDASYPFWQTPQEKQALAPPHQPADRHAPPSASAPPEEPRLKTLPPFANRTPPDLPPRSVVYSMVGEGLKPIDTPPLPPSAASASSHSKCEAAQQATGNHFRPSLDPKDYYKAKALYSEYHKWRGPPAPRCFDPALSKAPEQAPPNKAPSPSFLSAAYGKKKYLLQQLHRDPAFPEGDLRRTEEVEPCLSIPDPPAPKKEGGASPNEVPEGEAKAAFSEPHAFVSDGFSKGSNFTERGNKLIPVANVQPMRKLSDDGEAARPPKAPEEVGTPPAPKPGQSEFMKVYQNVACPEVAMEPFRTPDPPAPTSAFGKEAEEVRKDLSLHFATPKGRHKLAVQKPNEDEGRSHGEEGRSQGKMGPMAGEGMLKAATETSVSADGKTGKRKYVRRKKIRESTHLAPNEAAPVATATKRGSKRGVRLRKVSEKVEDGQELQLNEGQLGSPASKATKSRVLRKNRRYLERSLHTQSRIRRALRSAHKSYTYNKNAAYEEELRRDEQRRLLRRVCKAGPQEEAPADNSKSSPAPELDDPPPVEEEAEPTAEEGKSKAKRVPRLKRITRKRRGLNLCDLDVIGRKRKYNIHRKRGLRRFRVGVAESTAPAQLSNGNDDQNLVVESSEAPVPASESSASGHALEMPLDARRLFVCKETGESMLHKAARLGYEEVAEYCLAVRSYDPNIRDNAGYTPLHECSVAGNLSIGITLINSGAEVNAKALDGTRPLHDAVDNDRVEMARLLLAHGADAHIANYSGRTPAKLARSPAMKAFIQGFLADVNIHSDEVHPWEFRPSHEARGLSGCDILSFAPADEDKGEEELFFDFSEAEPLRMYYLTLPGVKGPRNYHSLADVAQKVGRTEPELMADHQNEMTFVEISSDEWENICKNSPEFGVIATQSGRLFLAEEDAESATGDRVKLVEVSPRLKELLGVATETLDRCEVVRSSEKEAVKGKVHKKKAERRGLTESSAALETLLRTPVIASGQYGEQVKKPCSVTLFDIKHSAGPWKIGRTERQADTAAAKRRSAKTCNKKKAPDRAAEALLLSSIKLLKNLSLAERSEDGRKLKVTSRRERKVLLSSIDHIAKNHLNGVILRGSVLVSKTPKKKRKKGAVLAESAFSASRGAFSSTLFEMLTADPPEKSEGQKHCKPRVESREASLPVLEKEDAESEESAQVDTDRGRADIPSSDREMPQLTPCAAL